MWFFKSKNEPVSEEDQPISTEKEVVETSENFVIFGFLDSRMTYLMALEQLTKEGYQVIQGEMVLGRIMVACRKLESHDTKGF